MSKMESIKSMVNKMKGMDKEVNFRQCTLKSKKSEEEVDESFNKGKKIA